jgi:hypothetical protein
MRVLAKRVIDTIRIPAKRLFPIAFAREGLQLVNFHLSSRLVPCVKPTISGSFESTWKPCLSCENKYMSWNTDAKVQMES